MAYTDFKSLKQVTEELDLYVKRTNFLKTKAFKINDYFIEMLNRSLEDGATMASEISICENLISPIIREVAYPNKLSVFSHIAFGIEGDEILQGYPDYILGTKARDDSSLGTPILCLGEAKKDDFVAGWGQVAAEMYTTHKVNKENGFEVPVFGLVSTGKEWEFGVLENNVLKLDTRFYSSRHPQELFDTLNWIFRKCRKNLESVLDLDD